VFSKETGSKIDNASYEVFRVTGGRMIDGERPVFDGKDSLTLKADAKIYFKVKAEGYTTFFTQALQLWPDQTFNVSVKLSNTNLTTYTGTLWVNITDSTGTLVNYSSQSINVVGNSIASYSVTDIDLTTWNSGAFTILAGATYNPGSLRTNRVETFTLGEVWLNVTTENYMCNQTTEQYNVTLSNPFGDSMQYNVRCSYIPIERHSFFSKI